MRLSNLHSCSMGSLLPSRLRVLTLTKFRRHGLSISSCIKNRGCDCRRRARSCYRMSTSCTQPGIFHTHTLSDRVRPQQGCCSFGRTLTIRACGMNYCGTANCRHQEFYRTWYWTESASTRLCGCFATMGLLSLICRRENAGRSPKDTAYTDACIRG